MIAKRDFVRIAEPVQSMLEGSPIRFVNKPRQRRNILAHGASRGSKLHFSTLAPSGAAFERRIDVAPEGASQIISLR